MIIPIDMSAIHTGHENHIRAQLRGCRVRQLSRERTIVSCLQVTFATEDDEFGKGDRGTDPHSILIPLHSTNTSLIQWLSQSLLLSDGLSHLLPLPNI